MRGEGWGMGGGGWGVGGGGWGSGLRVWGLGFRDVGSVVVGWLSMKVKKKYQRACWWPRSDCPRGAPAIKFTALCGADLVPYPADCSRNKPRVAHRVVITFSEGCSISLGGLINLY